jgi:hypothetical protein
MPKFDKKLLRVPSFVATLLTGLILMAMVLTVMFSWDKVKNFTLYEKVMSGALFGLVLGIHGLLHLGLEVAYNFNPLSENNKQKLKKSELN